MSPRDEAETYLVAFNACVRDAQVEEIMCRCVGTDGGERWFARVDHSLVGHFAPGTFFCAQLQ